MGDDKDLCKRCKHYWQDFPMPLDHVVSHCEILDRMPGHGINKNDMDNEIPYPCLKCPFDQFIKSN